MSEVKVVSVQYDNDIVRIAFSDETYALLIRDHYDAIIGQGLFLAQETIRIMKGLR